MKFEKPLKAIVKAKEIANHALIKSCFSIEEYFISKRIKANHFIKLYLFALFQRFSKTIL